MERTAYHRPLDLPLDLERVMNLRARDLQPGDVIFAVGYIPLVVTDVQDVVCGLTTVAYDCSAGSGMRVYPSEQFIQLKRRVSEAH